MTEKVFKKKSLAGMLTAFAVIFLSASVIHAATIDSTGGVRIGGAGVSPFGTPGTEIYGQTFIAPSVDTSLNDFSLFLGGRYGGTGDLNLKGYLAEWNGTTPGDNLYTSDIRTMNGAGNSQQFLFDTGSIHLTAGDTYVAYLSVLGLSNLAASTFYMPYVDDKIAGGFVQSQGGVVWESGRRPDVYFVANFSAAPVPEPSTMLLLGSGLIGLVGYGRKRFKK